MGEMSIPSFILVASSEGIVVAILGLLTIGGYDFFKRKYSLLRVIVFVVLYTIAGYFITKIINDNVLEKSLIYFILSCILFMSVIRLKYYESIVASLLSSIALFITSTCSVLLIASLFNINLNQLCTGNLVVLASIPERVLQIAMIIVFYYYRIKIVSFDGNVKKKEYYVQLSVYMVSLGTLIFLIAILCNNLFFNGAGFIRTPEMQLYRLNIYLSLFVTIILTLAVKSMTDNYKNKNKLNNTEMLQNIDYLINLIDEKKYNDAKVAANSIKDHIKNSI